MSLVFYILCSRELEAMRREMSAGHIQSTQQALTALAQEKDDALSEARHVWKKEQNNLRKKVSSTST